MFVECSVLVFVVVFDVCLWLYGSVEYFVI